MGYAQISYKKLRLYAPKKKTRAHHRPSQRKVEFADKLRANMTPAERHLWAKLAKLSPVFETQEILFGYIPDFLCRKCKLVIEVDGPVHDDRKEQDKMRDLHLSTHKFRTLRFTNQQVFENRAQVLGMIIEAL